ncbi:MAG: Fic family protein [Methanomassiliicoccales archaeon]
MINDHHILRDFKPRFATVRHKRKVPFSPQITVSPDFSRRLLRIRELDFQLGRFILKAKDYAEIATEAYAANIHWSTKLEGNPLSEEEVRRITRSTLQGEMIEQRNGPIQEIINHALFHAGEESIPRDWEEAWICSLHRTLLDGTGSTAAIGSLRTTETSVYENGPERTEIFRPCPGPHVAAEMASLLKWLRETAPAFDPIVAAALFFHEFESIHPFEDGNGRVGRTLFHLYLQKNGLKRSSLCKLDAELLTHSDVYYNILAYTDEAADYGPLLDMFSIAVLRSYEVAVQTLAPKDLLSSTMDENSKRLIIRFKECGDWLSVKDAVSFVEGAGEQTVRHRLQELVEMGVLEVKGRTKGMRFRFKVPFEQASDDMGRTMPGVGG